MPDVVYDAILGSGNNIRQVLSSGFQLNAQIIKGRNSGAVDPSAQYGGPCSPRMTMQSADVAGVLGILSVTAGSGLITSGVELPFNKRANGGTFASGSSHYTINCTRALAWPTSFSVSQDAEAATADIEVALLSSDGTNPVTDSVNQSLASQSFNAQYGMGIAVVNGTTIADVTGFSVQTGIQVVQRSYNGLNFPTRAYIVERNPMINLTFESFDDLDTFGLGYTAITSVAVYFRKRTAGAEFVGTGTGQHIKFSFAAGIITPESVQGSPETGEASLQLSGNTLVASTTSTIP